MISLLAKLLKALNSDSAPGQIALAVVFAAAMGLTPLTTPHNALLLLILLLLRVNLSMFIVSLGLFSLIGYAIDPLSNQIGLAILQAEGLQALWTELYQSSFWRLLAFNNTLVMGSTVLGLTLALPLFFFSRWLVVNYRQHVLDYVRKTRLVTWLKSGKLITAYQQIS